MKRGQSDAVFAPRCVEASVPGGSLGDAAGDRASRGGTQETQHEGVSSERFSAAVVLSSLGRWKLEREVAVDKNETFL